MTEHVAEIIIVLDSVDPERLAGFWCAALNYDRLESVEQYAVLVPRGRRSNPMMLIQGVPEPKQGKNRMHLDLHVADVEGEVLRLVGLGARRVGEGSIGDSIRWVRMVDPEGNEFDLGSG